MKKPLKNLHKFLIYVLGYKPYEFGLVPDEKGFVKIKELIKAFNEDENAPHLQLKNIKDILLMLDKPEIEVKDNLIRAKCKNFSISKCKNPPKILYTCIRTKAIRYVIEKGISPFDNKYVILSSAKEMAYRIGKRKDISPALLAINTKQAIDKNFFFYHLGDSIYLTEFIPIETFTAPPAHREREKPAPNIKKQKEKTPGAFILDLEKDISWKNNKKRLRREKIKLKRGF
jgi:putative RNA 2'-phosphotransferase